MLSLIPGRAASGGNLNHAGLRVRTAEELVEVQRRLEAAGLPTRREDGVECCYAKQTKFWVSDPDQALWEIYVFHEDVNERGTAAPPKAEPVSMRTEPIALPRAWEHHLREVIPAAVPHVDNALHEIRLEGAINAAPGSANRAGFIADCLRALRSGGVLHLHGLAADSGAVSDPQLGGPAAAVEYVPAVSEVVDEVAGAGFVDVTIETLSQTAYFIVDDMPMREIRVSARKPGHRPANVSHAAVYLGPMQQVVDDFGNVLRRGVVTPLNVHDWQVLSRGSAKESFLFLRPDGLPRASCEDRAKLPIAGESAQPAVTG